MPAIPLLRRLDQNDPEFKQSLGYIARFSQTNRTMTSPSLSERIRS